MLKRFFVVFCLFALGIMPFNDVGHTKPFTASLKFKVSVTFSCENEQIKSSIESHIKRELRSLHNVEIVPQHNKPPLEIAIVATETTHNMSNPNGIAFAVNFLERSTPNSTHFRYPRLYVISGDIRELDRLCKACIVSFDTDVLEPTRELFNN